MTETSGNVLVAETSSRFRSKIRPSPSSLSRENEDISFTPLFLLKSEPLSFGHPCSLERAADDM